MDEGTLLRRCQVWLLLLASPTGSLKEQGFVFVVLSSIFPLEVTKLGK
ncbi:MAG: hypothetical protein QXG77_03180 [Nitrososphaerota archaeon]